MKSENYVWRLFSSPFSRGSGLKDRGGGGAATPKICALTPPSERGAKELIMTRWINI